MGEARRRRAAAEAGKPWPDPDGTGTLDDLPEDAREAFGRAVQDGGGRSRSLELPVR